MEKKSAGIKRPFAEGVDGLFDDLGDNQLGSIDNNHAQDAGQYLYQVFFNKRKDKVQNSYYNSSRIASMAIIKSSSMCFSIIKGGSILKMLSRGRLAMINPFSRSLSYTAATES